jgi:hypothetical protein
MEQKKMIQSKVIWENILALTMAGGLAFWLANFAISLTPIAAEYRSVMAISYYPMLLAALIGGLLIGLCVSYFLLRFHGRIPGKDPIIKSGILTFFALILATILIGGPSSYLATDDVLRYFIIGTVINVLRFLALGISIGLLYNKIEG